MQLTNTTETYGVVHQVLHWATALLILMLLAGGVFMHDLPQSSPDEIAFKVQIYSMHKSIGVAALLIALLRIAWALIQPHPRPLHGGMEAFAARTVHIILYAAIILMPVTGWLHHAATEGYAPLWWGFGDTLAFIPKDPDVAHFFNVAHRVVAVTLVASLFLHISGAIKHAVIDKDQTLARMVPGKFKGELHGEQPVTGGLRSRTTGPLATSLMVLLLAGGATGGVYAYETSKDMLPIAQLSKASETANWQIIREKSQLGIEITQLGSPVRGSFDEWTADVEFNPDDPGSAKIKAEIALGSLRLGDIADQAMSAEFLNAAAHPVATFVAETVAKTENGFQAEGELSLSGVTLPFALLFTFSEDNGIARVAAEAVITRLDFGVGKAYADSSSVGTEVKVLINIEAERKGGEAPAS